VSECKPLGGDDDDKNDKKRKPEGGGGGAAKKGKGEPYNAVAARGKGDLRQRLADGARSAPAAMSDMNKVGPCRCFSLSHRMQFLKKRG